MFERKKEKKTEGGIRVGLKIESGEKKKKILEDHKDGETINLKQNIQTTKDS